MCNGISFCGTCSPSHEIQSYIDGLSHVPPVYGDGAQAYAATRLRRRRFYELLVSFNSGISQWPESQERLGYDDHISRLLSLGKYLASSDDMPETLRRIFDDRESLRKRRLKVSQRRTILRRWMRRHLAEAELLVLGRRCYAQPPQGLAAEQPMLLAG